MQVIDEIEQTLDELEAAVRGFQEFDLDGLDPAAELLLVRRLEVLRRRLDHGTDRSAGHLDRSAAFSLDGHRNAKGALKAIGRLPGAEAHGRVQRSRALRELPLVEAAYARGEIPTAHVRAIARTVANPRVADHVAKADPIFAEAGSTLSYDELCVVLRRWSAYADADGAAQDAEVTHERRHLSLTENAFDGSWTIEGTFGALQGAALAEMLFRFEDAEFRADWAHARAEHGPDARVEHLPRTRAQRRADALLELARQAGVAPVDGRSPEPLVNIVVDQATFEDELRRAAGQRIEVDPNDVEGRRCHTVGGTQLHPSDAVAAALVGHVRRVVIDAAGNVIDLGRKRRCFTGSSRDAAMLQALLRGPGGLGCLWPGCDGTGGCLQADHRQAAARGGPTDIANSDAYCGFHNRIRERGFRPVRGADGTWTIHRPVHGGPSPHPSDPQVQTATEHPGHDGRLLRRAPVERQNAYVPDDFLIAANPDESSTLPYLVRLPLGPAGIVLKVRDTSGRVLDIIVDSHERYAWNFADQQATLRRGGLVAGDYGIELDGRLVASVERKSLADFVSTLTSGKLRYLLADLAVLDRAAVVVEDRYSSVFRLDRVRPAVVAEGLAEAQVRFPSVPIVFCETRKLAQEWTYRFLGAAAAHVAEHADAEHPTAHLPLAGPVPDREPTSAEIRAWAVSMGMEISDRGRIPAEVRQRYELAHRW